MKLFWKNRGSKALDRQENMSGKEYKSLLKNSYKLLIKTSFLTFVSFVTLVAFTVAWFISNSQVSGSSISVSAGHETLYYLATLPEGNQQGIYDNKSSGALSKALNKFNRNNHGNGNVIYLDLPFFTVGENRITASDGKEYILGDADGVSLMVNDRFNVNNIVQDDSVGPGSRGEIKFYIIPQKGGLKEANIIIYLSAYKLEKDSNLQKTERAVMIDRSEGNQPIRNFLSGHILLFKEKDTNGDYKGHLEPNLYDDGSVGFSLKLNAPEGGWEENKPIEVTVYWCWPYRFENIVYTGLPESVFSAKSGDYESILTWIYENKGLMVSGTNLPEQAPSDTMSNADRAKWNAGYNKADQIIGNTVAYFVWTISGTDSFS